MLIELWERLRGYDKWIETEATIVSSKKLRKAAGLREPDRTKSRMSGELLMWKDQFARKQCGPFVTYDTSALYQMLEGETISIRFDPERPNRYYNRELFRSWVLFVAKLTFVIVVAVGFLVWRIWMIVTRRGF